MFVDTGVPLLFTECYKLGAQKQRMVVAGAGGAFFHSAGGEDYFQIGKRNFVMLRKLLWKNGLLLKAHDVGGNISRTMLLNNSNGEMIIKTQGVESTLVAPLKNGKLLPS
jgi:chemotaxis protein CheD